MELGNKVVTKQVLRRVQLKSKDEVASIRVIAATSPIMCF